MRLQGLVAVVATSIILTACSTPTPPLDTGTPSPATTSAASGPIRGPLPSVATPLTGSVLTPPIPVPATDGRVHLAYEVLLTNVLAQEVTLTSLVVLDRDV